MSLPFSCPHLFIFKRPDNYPDTGGKKLKRKVKTGRANVYPENHYLEPLKRIWLLSDQPCGKRLKMTLPLWLPYYGETYGVLESGVYEGLLSMSAATIDRLLTPLRVKYKRSYGGTKPGSILKKHIPVKTNQWDEDRPGYLEGCYMGSDQNLFLINNKIYRKIGEY